MHDVLNRDEIKFPINTEIIHRSTSISELWVA